MCMPKIGFANITLTTQIALSRSGRFGSGHCDPAGWVTPSGSLPYNRRRDRRSDWGFTPLGIRHLGNASRDCHLGPVICYFKNLYTVRLPSGEWRCTTRGPLLGDRHLGPLIFFSCDQAALWLVQSVSLSVRLSVRHTFFTMFPPSYHHGIFRSDYHGQKWCPCKWSRSKVKVTEVKTQLSRFRTVTPVWFHIWQWNHAHSLKHRRGALSFLRSSVKFQGHTRQKIANFDPNLVFPDYNYSLNWPMAVKWCTKPEVG